MDLERRLDVDRGHTKDKDSLPARLVEEAVTVNGKRVRLGPETWAAMRDEFYHVRGWSPDGVPALAIPQ